MFLTHKLIYQGKFAEAQVSCNNSFKMACEIGDTTQYGVSSYLLYCALLCCAVLCCAVLCCADSVSIFCDFRSVDISPL